MSPRTPSRTQNCLVTQTSGLTAVAYRAGHLARVSQVGWPQTQPAVWRYASIWPRRYLGQSGQPLQPHLQSNIACASVPRASVKEEGKMESAE